MDNIEFLKVILENLLQKKEEIKIKKSEDEFGILLEIEVDKSDMPVLIGKKGNTINSIRNIMRVAGGVKNERVNIKIIENN
ncbi:MAG: KH domain-containing protein [Candidatus Gracilibacteria bacterium]|nr:KH domain-containing protein [Candidatus Gracilibacteria bacterium]